LRRCILSLLWNIDVDGKKNYKGPSIDMKAMQQGEVMGMTVDGHENGPEMEGSEGALKDERERV
jgi:hypothetical protein